MNTHLYGGPSERSVASTDSPADPFTTTIDEADGPPLEHPAKDPFAANVISSMSPVLQVSAPVVSFARQDENVTIHE